MRTVWIELLLQLVDPAPVCTLCGDSLRNIGPVFPQSLPFASLYFDPAGNCCPDSGLDGKYRGGMIGQQRLYFLSMTSYWLLHREERPPITHEALNIVGSHHRAPIMKARTELGYEPLVGYNEAMVTVAEYLGSQK